MELRKFISPDGQDSGAFGWSVALNGATALISAPSQRSNAGAVYSFDVITGQLFAEMLPHVKASGDEFGHAVAIEGIAAIVGAPGVDDRGSYSGAAYVFNVVTGAQIAKFSPADGAPFDEFGHAVAISRRTALIGAPFDDDNGDLSGSAYLYSVETRSQFAKLKPSDGAAGDTFGRAVAIHGGTVLVGSPWSDYDGFDSGAAYFFDATTGAETMKLTPSRDGMSGEFGASVALHGGLALIGAPQDRQNGENSGAAYLFEVSTGKQLAKLIPSDAAPQHLFGSSVALYGGLALVGAEEDNSNGANSGSAYLFNAYTGQELAKLTPTDPKAFDVFGRSVALNDSFALIGATEELSEGFASLHLVVPEPASATLLFSTLLVFPSRQRRH